MRRKAIAAIAVIAVSSMLATSMDVNRAGATDDSGTLPASGVELDIEDGTSIDEIYDETGSLTSSGTISADLESTVSDSKSDSNTPSDNLSGLEILGSDDEIKTADVAANPIGKGADKANARNNEQIAIAQAEAEKDPENFSNLVIAQVTNYVNVRDIPSEEGEVVGKLYDDSVGNFLEEENGWYKIKSGSVTGYVKAEYCVTGDEAIELAKRVGTRMATVNTTTLKVRTEPSTDSQVLGLVPIEDDLSVVEELDGWVKVSIEEGEGYVSAEFVNLRTDFVKAESKAEEEARLERERRAQREAQAAAQAAAAKNNTPAKSNNGKTYAAPSFSDNSMGSSVANYACQFVGNPYVYGGSSLTNGTDCSGFVMSVYKAYGVSLPHSSSGDRSVGANVEGGLANAQPGDIVCYSGHVAIYIGNGQIVHASTSKTGIIISNASYRNVLAVRRIF